MRAVTGGLLACSTVVHAQQSEKVYRIGYLREGAVPLHKTFWDAMREYGWVEGRNVTIEARYADRLDRLPPLAEELVRLRVDLIIAVGTLAVRAAKEATKITPIVFSVAADPIQNGLVSNLAHPGANLTGFVMGLYEEKLLEVLREALPQISRAAFPVPVDVPPVSDLREFPSQRLTAAGRALGVEVIEISVRAPEDFRAFYAAARKASVDAVVVLNIVPWMPYLQRIANEAAKIRMPTIGFDRRFVDAGGLMSYGPVELQRWPRLAAQIDRILRGAKPRDLPVEFPTKFELVINAKTAKALGLTIPQSLLLRADEVIQ